MPCASSGVNAAFLNSTLDMAGQRAVEKSVLDGTLDLLYVAPERLVQERMLGLSGQGPPVADRHRRGALRVAMGPRLPARVPPAARSWPSAFRACRGSRSPPPPTTRRARRSPQELRLERAKRFVASFDRPNIRYTIAEMGSMGARDRLWQFLEAEHPGDAGIVYCLSRKSVEETAAWLTEQGPHGARLSRRHAGR